MATYVDDKGQIIWLQIGSARYPLDERTEAAQATRMGGLVTSLTVTSVGLPSVTLNERYPARQVTRLVKLITSAEAREVYRAVKNPAGGPGTCMIRAGLPAARGRHAS